MCSIFFYLEGWINRECTREEKYSRYWFEDNFRSSGLFQANATPNTALQIPNCSLGAQELTEKPERLNEFMLGSWGSKWLTIFIAFTNLQETLIYQRGMQPINWCKHLNQTHWVSMDQKRSHGLKSSYKDHWIQNMYKGSEGLKDWRFLDKTERGSANEIQPRIKVMEARCKKRE